MKHTILTYLLLLAVPTCFAQKFELGLNGGIGLNSTPFQSLRDSEDYKRGSNVKPTFSLSLSHTINYKYKVGVSAGYMPLNYYSKFWHYDVWFDDNGMGGEAWIHHKEHIRLSGGAAVFKAFVNRAVSIGRKEFYAGLSVGYFYSMDHDPVYIKPAGITLGVQPGCTYHITKHLGLNVELQANYVYGKDVYQRSNFSPYNKPFSLFDASATVGLRFRF